jgi:NIMA (never in mitosis gene a)-related kinase
MPLKKYTYSLFLITSQVKLGKLSEKEKENAVNEVRILASLAHPNIIAYKDAFIEESS